MADEEEVALTGFLHAGRNELSEKMKQKLVDVLQREAQHAIDGTRSPEAMSWESFCQEARERRRA